MSRPSRLRTLAIAATVALLAALPMPVLAQSAASPAASSPGVASSQDPVALGTQLATRFLTILGEPDAAKTADLQAFLAPEFQIVRANGDRLGRAAYIAAPATVHQFTVTDVAATAAGDLIVVSYLLSTTETINGAEQTTTAPRLSVFRLVDGSWQMSAHSNFGAIPVAPAPGAPSAPSTPAASPAS
jgi:hypothetical protein